MKKVTRKGVIQAGLFAAAISLQLIAPQFVQAAEPELSQTAESQAKGELTEVGPLDEMVVTATRILQEARKVPANVTVITAEDIKSQNIMTIDEALQNSVGVFVDRPKGVSDVGTGIMMRGFSDSNVLVLLDGQPLNDAYNGSVNWNAVSIESVARIEIARGATSSLYGGHAVGGVINIISKDPKENSVTTDLSYGSDKTWRKSVGVHQKLSDKLGISFGYEERSTDGHATKPASSTSNPITGTIPSGPQGTGVVVSNTAGGSPRYLFGDTGKDAYSGDTYWLKWKYLFDQDKSLTYSYTRDKLNYHYDHPTTYIHDASGNPLYSGYAVLPDGRYFKLSEANFTDYYGRRTANIHAVAYQDNKQDISIHAGLNDITANGYSSGNTLDRSKPGSDSSYPSKNWNFDMQKAWRDIGKNTIVAGMNWQSNEMNQTTATLAHWDDYHSITAINSINGGKSRLWAAFIQDQYQFNDQWSLFGGLRYDNFTKYDGYSKEFKTNGIDKNFESTTYTELSPKIALEYQVNKDTTYYTSYGHSFNPPTLYNLYRWTTTSSMLSYDSPANPDLKPEASDTLEIGVKKNVSKNTTMNLSLYQTKTRDMIARVLFPAGTFLTNKDAYIYENLNSATRKGIEFDVNHQINNQWDVYLNYAWQQGKWNSSSAYPTGTVISSIPEHLLHFGGKYHYGKWSANLDASYVSERNDDDSVTGVFGSSDAYFIVNTKIRYQVQKNMAVAFGINNLFDRQYFSYYDASGRSYNVELQYNF